MNATTTIIGGGNMGEALVSTLLTTRAPDEVTVVEPDAARASVLQAKYGIAVLPIAEAVRGAATVVLVVKPHLVEPVLAQMDGALTDEHLLVSLAGGVLATRIERTAPTDHAVVVRCVPNLAIALGAGLTAIAGGTHAGAEHLDRVQKLFEPGGPVLRVTEAQLDIVTAVSGSGPAYLFYVIEALIDAGVLLGLSYDVSTMLARQTLLAAGALARDPASEPAKLRAAITSPGGMTIVAVKVLEERAVRGAMMAACVAARDRAIEVGREQT